jgi:hypothetical protein
MCKPINYSLALEEHDIEAVHCHVGREPSGRPSHPAASTVVSLFPADIAWAYRDFEPYGSLSNRFTGEFQVEAFA